MTIDRKPIIAKYKPGRRLGDIFNKNEFQLIQQGALIELNNFPAHELTHTIQQGSVLRKHKVKQINRVQWSGFSSRQIDVFLERLFTLTDFNSIVLLFDEADALFGKRSQVKDTHDRYANIETSYLLQKVKQYGGVVFVNCGRKTRKRPLPF